MAIRDVLAVRASGGEFGEVVGAEEDAARCDAKLVEVGTRLLLPAEGLTSKT